MNEARNSNSTSDNYKKITDTTVEETGAQMVTPGLEMEYFDGSPYSLMFLNNKINN